MSRLCLGFVNLHIIDTHAWLGVWKPPHYGIHWVGQTVSGIRPAVFMAVRIRITVFWFMTPSEYLV